MYFTNEKLANRPLEELGFDKVTCRALRSAGCRTAEDVVDLSLAELASIDNMGIVKARKVLEVVFKQKYNFKCKHFNIFTRLEALALRRAGEI